MNRIRACLLFALIMCVAPVSASPMPVQHELAQARLSGQGSYRWFGIKLYDAYLWCERGATIQSAPLDAKLILELVYARELAGARIAAASIDEMRKLKIGTATQHAAWLKLMQETFPDVREGTRLSGVYLPGQGARFYHDGRLLKEITDAEFARAFFAIWLDQRTSAAQLRNQLLGLPA